MSASESPDKLERFAGFWLEKVSGLVCVLTVILLPPLCTFPLWAHYVGTPEAPGLVKIVGVVLALFAWPLPILMWKMERRSTLTGNERGADRIPGDVARERDSLIFRNERYRKVLTDLLGIADNAGGWADTGDHSPFGGGVLVVDLALELHVRTV